MEDYRNMERCSGEPCCIFAERICADNEKEILKMEKDTKEKEVPEWRWENTSGDDHPTIRAVLCDPDYWVLKQPFEVEIIASDGTNSRTAAVIQAGQKEYEPMEVQLDLTGLQREIKLELVSTAETKRAVVINPEWSAKTVEE